MPKPDQARTQSSASVPLAALGLLAAALLSMVGHPLGWLPLLLLLALAAICWRWPGSWLMVVPAALPLLDFSYLSGRLFWSEFDTLLLLALAIAYARERVVPAMAWPGRFPLAAYAVSAFIGLAVGLLPLAPLGLNAFTQYTSSYHALRAVKGLAFAQAFLPLIKAEWHRLVDSLIDEPRLDFLFFWLLAIALVSGGKILPRRRTSISSRTRRTGREGVVQS